MEQLLSELQQLLVGVSIMQDLTMRAKDSLVSFGERLSTRLFAAFLRKEVSLRFAALLHLSVHAWVCVPVCVCQCDSGPSAGQISCAKASNAELLGNDAAQVMHSIQELQPSVVVPVQINQLCQFWCLTLCVVKLSWFGRASDSCQGLGCMHRHKCCKSHQPPHCKHESYACHSGHQDTLTPLVRDAWP